MKETEADKRTGRLWLVVDLACGNLFDRRFCTTGCDESLLAGAASTIAPKAWSKLNFACVMDRLRVLCEILVCRTGASPYNMI